MFYARLMLFLQVFDLLVKLSGPEDFNVKSFILVELIS